MRIVFAKEIGFCFGVKRALKMVEDNISELKKPVRMYGSLVHNEEVVKKLEREGIKVVSDIKGIREGTLIITAHGVSPAVKNRLLKKRELSLLDTTCPLVVRAQKAAASLTREGRKVLILGDSNHQEVLGIKGAAGKKAIIFSSKEELLRIKPEKDRKYGLVAQTTQSFEKFKEIEEIVKIKFPQVRVVNTICPTTFERQKEIRKLAKETDAVLVIGSTTSANTKRLYQISIEINHRTFFVRTAGDLKRKWFEGIESVGIGAGASTPDWIIDEVVEKLKTLSSVRNLIC